MKINSILFLAILLPIEAQKLSIFAKAAWIDWNQYFCYGMVLAMFIIDNQ